MEGNSRLRSGWVSITLVLIAIGATVAALLSYRWMINPQAWLPKTPVDAVVVLAGGTGERLPRAVEIAASQPAKTLVVSTGSENWHPAAAREAIRTMCRSGAADFEVVCHFAQPDKTRGEASTYAQMAAERNWKSIVLVTSDYHLLRATRWFNRCFKRPVYYAPAASSKTIRLIIHEWLGLIAFYTVQRHCE